MATLVDSYFQNAQLSLAAYADLSVGMTNDEYKAKLIFAGFTDALATEFVANYTIVADTFTDWTGLQTTLFQKNGSPPEKILAVRGSTNLLDFAIDGLIVAGEADSINPQYTSLKEKEWGHSSFSSRDRVSVG